MDKLSCLYSTLLSQKQGLYNLEMTAFCCPLMTLWQFDCIQNNIAMLHSYNMHASSFFQLRHLSKTGQQWETRDPCLWEKIFKTKNQSTTNMYPVLSNRKQQFFGRGNLYLAIPNRLHSVVSTKPAVLWEWAGKFNFSMEIWKCGEPFQNHSPSQISDFMQCWRTHGE